MGIKAGQDILEYFNQEYSKHTYDVTALAGGDSDKSLVLRIFDATGTETCKFVFIDGRMMAYGYFGAAMAIHPTPEILVKGKLWTISAWTSLISITPGKDGVSTSMENNLHSVLDGDCDSFEIGLMLYVVKNSQTKHFIRDRQREDPAWNRHQAVVPFKEVGKGATGGTEVYHPAAAMVRISNPSGTTALIGSALKHQNWFTLSVCRAKMERRHGETVHYAGETLVEVELSADQFARMISSVGKGEGTLATLSWFGRSIDNPPVDTPKLEVQKEYVRDLKEMTETTMKVVQTIDALIEGGAVKKSDLRALRSQVATVMGAVSGKGPFLAERFTEQMEKVLASAKTELETFIALKGLPGSRDGTPSYAAIDDSAERAQALLGADDD